MRINLQKKWILTGAIALVSLLFVLPTIGYGILRWFVLPPEKLTPLVVNKTNEFIQAHLDCEKVELTYFETYPYLGIRLTHGHLISRLASDSTQSELAIPSDSLLAFQQVVLAFNPTDYLFKGVVTIKRFAIDQARFYGYVNESGATNWSIYQSESDSLKQHTKEDPLPPIDLQEFHITNGQLTYDNRQQATLMQVEELDLHLFGSLTQGENQLQMEAHTASIQVETPDYSLTEHTSLHVKSRLSLSNHYQYIQLDDTELRINQLPFTLQGSIERLPTGNRQQVHLAFGMQVDNLNELLAYVPEAYFNKRKEATIEGKIRLEGTLIGELSDSLFPSFSLCCQVEQGAYHVKGIEQGIDTLEMDVDLHYNGTCPDSSAIAIDRFRVIGKNITWNLNGEVHDLFRNPTIQASLDGKINFTQLGQQLFNPDTLEMAGQMDTHLQLNFTLDDILNSRFGKIQASGQMHVDSFQLYSKPFDLRMLLAGCQLQLGSSQEENAYMQAKGVFSANLQLDSLDVHYKDVASTNVSRLSLTARTAQVIDTSALIPLTTQLKFAHLRTKLPDSTWVAIHRGELKGGIKSSASDKKTPTAAALFTLDTLKYILLAQHTGIITSGNQFTMEAIPYKEVIVNRLKSQRDSLRLHRYLQRQDSLRKQPSDTTNSATQFLRKWEAKGKMSFDQLRIVSRLFPLPMYMEKTQLNYSTNQVTLQDARLHLGESDLTLNGEIKQIRRAFLRGGKLTGQFKLHSQLIDCNQLMQALYAGQQFAEQQQPASFDEEALTHMTSDSLTALTDSSNQLLVIPALLDLDFDMKADEIRFKDLTMKEVTGEVTLRDQRARLNQLQMQSNIGQGQFSLAYATPTPQQAAMGIDLDLQQIQVERLIDLYPAIDTLVPMLRSFEGVVDCQLTATCQTDSTFSLLFPTLKASCFLSGHHMTLLDGETFTEISKTLMFKNKERNIIDSIAVDLAIRDNQIEVFPFLIEMDRYKVAVGGTHNLDMTFNYHISVLKSPVPFKLGIDIKGNLDDFKYSIVKCKYKDFLKPAKQAELDSTRRNIRQELREAVRKELAKTAVSNP